MCALVRNDVELMKVNYVGRRSAMQQRSLSDVFGGQINYFLRDEIKYKVTKNLVDIIIKIATKQKTCDRRFSTLSTGFSTGKNRKTPGKTGVFWGVIVVCTVVFHSCGKHFSLQNTVKTPIARRKYGYARQLHLSATQSHPHGKHPLGRCPDGAAGLPSPRSYSRW